MWFLFIQLCFHLLVYFGVFCPGNFNVICHLYTYYVKLIWHNVFFAIFLWVALNGETHMPEGRKELEGSGEAEAGPSRGRWMTMTGSGGSKRKPCPRVPAGPCVRHVSCVIVRDRTACTALRCWQAQNETGYPEETPRGQSKSIPDQQLEKTQRTQVTYVHLRCCWTLCATSSTASLLPPICILGVRQVIYSYFCSVAVQSISVFLAAILKVFFSFASDL